MKNRLLEKYTNKINLCKSCTTLVAAQTKKTKSRDLNEFVIDDPTIEKSQGCCDSCCCNPCCKTFCTEYIGSCLDWLTCNICSYCDDCKKCCSKCSCKKCCSENCGNCCDNFWCGCENCGDRCGDCCSGCDDDDN